MPQKWEYWTIPGLTISILGILSAPGIFSLMLCTLGALLCGIGVALAFVKVFHACAATPAPEKPEEPR